MRLLRWYIDWVKSHRSMSISIALHLILVIVLIVSVPTAVRQYQLAQNVTIVNAHMIHEPSQQAAAKLKPKPKQETVNVAKAKPKPKPKKKKVVKKKTPPKKKVAKKKSNKDLKKLQSQALANLKANLKANAQLRAQTAMRLTEKEKYIALISTIVKSHWNNHLQDSGFTVTLKIAQDAAGAVTDVSVVQSSGNPIFDRSAVVAVKKSSPLPLPQDTILQTQTRVMTLAFS